MNRSPFILFLFNPLFLFGQLENPALREMVDAESAFIRMAKEQNTRDAFLYFLSDDAITAGTGGPVKGKDQLKSQAPATSWLDWEVTYCDIASSGDLGYNTGPWRFYASKKEKDAVAFGDFHSVWRKQADGSWKNIANIGIGHSVPVKQSPLATTSYPAPAAAIHPKSLASLSGLMDAERVFLAEYREKGSRAYRGFSSPEIRFSRQGYLPFVTSVEKDQFLKSIDPYSNRDVVDGGVSRSGDFGYVYGKADFKDPSKKENVTKHATYLRVWKIEQNEWKIVVDVMTYQ